MKTCYQRDIREALFSLDDPTQLSPVQRDHLDECESCRGYWSAHVDALALGQRLQSERSLDAPEQQAVWLARRIARRANDRTDNVAEVRPKGMPIWSWGMAMAAIVALIWVQWTPQNSTHRVVHQPSRAKRMTPHSQRSKARVRVDIALPVQALQTLTRADSKALKALMSQAFASMAQSTSLQRSPLAIERAAVAFARQALDDEGLRGLSYLASSSAREARAFYELTDPDPSPISQRIPTPLASIDALIRDVDLPVTVSM